MATPRFLLETLPAAGGVAWLDRDEARHALGSRRLGEGDPVDLVDGRGGVASAVLGRERDHHGNLSALVREVQRLPRPAPAVHLGTAVPKGDRLGTLLDAAGELAVESVTPLDCEHSVTPAERLSGERPARILAEALKQSRGAWLTEIRSPASPIAFVEAHRGAGVPVMLLDPLGAPLSRMVAGQASIAMLVGPEGGFSEAELHAMQAAGATQASLGPTVLRIELAAAVACGVVRATA
ncbi:MAG: RsmE family RNA methyltransferase [Planctomycetota bacterium]